MSLFDVPMQDVEAHANQALRNQIWLADNLERAHFQFPSTLIQHLPAEAEEAIEDLELASPPPTPDGFRARMFGLLRTFQGVRQRVRSSVVSVTEEHDDNLQALLSSENTAPTDTSRTTLITRSVSPLTTGIDQEQTAQGHGWRLSYLLSSQIPSSCNRNFEYTTTTSDVRIPAVESEPRYVPRINLELGAARPSFALTEDKLTLKLKVGTAPLVSSNVQPTRPELRLIVPKPKNNSPSAKLKLVLNPLSSRQPKENLEKKSLKVLLKVPPQWTEQNGRRTFSPSASGSIRKQSSVKLNSRTRAVSEQNIGANQPKLMLRFKRPSY